MASKERQKDSLRGCFEASAEKVSKLKKNIPEDSLHRICLIASMRLVLLRKLRADGYIEGSNLSELWDAALCLGCPLLDASLDSCGLDPLSLLESTCVPDEVTDYSLVFERLEDLGLLRKAKTGKYKAKYKRTNRRRRGAFFTPDAMARRLVTMALGKLVHERSAEGIWSLRVADPACGDGRLLVASLDLMLDALDIQERQRGEYSRRLVKDCLRGVDLDPVCVAMARTSLWLKCDPALGEVEGLQQALVTGDSLLGPVDATDKSSLGWRRTFPDVFARPEAGFDVIVANPPFEVLTGFAKRKGLKSYTKRIRKSGYDLSLSGSLNTYRLFLERSLGLLATGGRMGIVLPFGFMMDRTASRLRAHIIRKAWIEQVEFYPESARSFEGVGQSVVLLTAHKEDGANKSIVMRNGTEDGDSNVVTLEQLELLDQKDLVLPPVAAADISLAARMSSVCSSSVGELADGMVGELDQTKYRSTMMSEHTDTILVRGVHMAPYHVNLELENTQERWVDWEKFSSQRGGGRWHEDIKETRLAQTGIVNMEAGRRLVAALVPEGVVLGNSVNYWVPKEHQLLSKHEIRSYLLAFLNSTPAEWRFRLSSSNNNINLYEIRSLPLPGLTAAFHSDRIESYLDGISKKLHETHVHPLGMVRQITAGWGAPGRTDRVVALLLGRVAGMLMELTPGTEKGRWLEHLMDHLVNWHMGLDEPDLDVMLEQVPARAWKRMP